MTEDGFILRESQGILYYSCLAFERLPHVRHGFSTRHGGTADSGGGAFNLGRHPADLPACLAENRRRFLSALQLENARLITLRQIHSGLVHIVGDISGHREPLEGDALIASRENAALAVQTADCFPILIADPMRPVVAAVHSGWRGTLAGILLRTIHEMQRAFRCDPAQLLIAVGPGIRTCCFEVGSEVANSFDEKFPEVRLAMPAPDRPGKYFLDLSKALNVQLARAGVPERNRHDLLACTRCNVSDFFSYRAEGKAAGRMMAVIGVSGK